MPMKNEQFRTIKKKKKKGKMCLAWYNKRDIK